MLRKLWNVLVLVAGLGAAILWGYINYVVATGPRPELILVP